MTVAGTKTADEVVGERGTERTTTACAPDRPLRADAARNRQKLIDAATAAFTDHGGEVALEDIAKASGVGIGTLYRHFPTREALVVAVYGQQVDALDARSVELLQTMPPGQALHEWMRGFVDFYAVKRGMLTLIKSMAKSAGGGQAETFAAARETMAGAADRMLSAAIEAKVIRADVTSADLMRALGGICLASEVPAGSEMSTTIVDLVYDGLRYGTTSA